MPREAGEILCISSEKRLLFLRYLYFWTDFFGNVGKRLEKEAKIDFKIYDVKDWETNNCNTHFAKYLKKSRQRVRIQIPFFLCLTADNMERTYKGNIRE